MSAGVATRQSRGGGGARCGNQKVLATAVGYSISCCVHIHLGTQHRSLCYSSTISRSLPPIILYRFRLQHVPTVRGVYARHLPSCLYLDHFRLCLSLQTQNVIRMAHHRLFRFLSSVLGLSIRHYSPVRSIICSRVHCYDMTGSRLELCRQLGSPNELQRLAMWRRLGCQGGVQGGEFSLGWRLIFRERFVQVTKVLQRRVQLRDTVCLWWHGIYIEASRCSLRAKPVCNQTRF